MKKSTWMAILVGVTAIVLFIKPFSSEERRFYKLADHYFDQIVFPTNPTYATQVGIHLYDSLLEDYSEGGMKKHIHDLKAMESQLSKINKHKLTETAQSDLELVTNQIRGELLTLQTIKPWEKNPDYYSSGITNSAFVILERAYAPADERLRSLIAREKLMPNALKQAQLNLKNPPKIYTEIALEQLPGSIHFFEKDVPEAFLGVTNEKLKNEFMLSNTAVIQALKKYQSWLKNEVLPRSHGDFRIGEATFRQKLLFNEMVDTPLDQLVRLDMENMRENQREFIRIAHELYPNKSLKQVIEAATTHHPAPNKLLDTFAETFNTLTTFINNKHIITIPSDIKPKMEESPPFLRAFTLASMDTPGPYETKATEGYFNVTLPNPTWHKAEIEEFMHTFSYPGLMITSIHETYPGHYVQFLWMQKIHDRVRKLIGANSNAEGWAHYTEQMMLDEGFGEEMYGNDVRAAKVLRLNQLLMALLRNARFIVGIKLHTGHMTMSEATDFFVREGYQPRVIGMMEAKRGTMDPTYLVYTLGKLQILKLRQDVKEKEGIAFNLQTFHDDFMRQGYPPIKIVRRAMLHNDSPTL